MDQNRAPQRDEVTSLLKEFSAQINVDLSGQQIELFGIYCEELSEWNQKINITALKDVKNVVIKHFIDSLTVVKYCSLAGSLVDIGTGGGVPGLPIKIKLPELQVSLIEPNRKKANFVRHMIRRLQLKNTEVVQARAQELDTQKRYDFAVSRACANLQKLCRMALPIVRPGGYVIVMQGNTGESRTHISKNLPPQARLSCIHSFDLPLKMGARSLVVVQKCFT